MGGQRIQRVPPTEKRGRVHSSTVTVVVLPEPKATEFVLDPRDVDIRTCRGSGAGGQHRNVTDSAVQATHRPTGLTVRCESERSQTQNRATALALLGARIWAQKNQRLEAARAGDRRQQVGSGQRADKRRTVRYQDGHVNDHVTGRSWTLREYLRGQW